MTIKIPGSKKFWTALLIIILFSQTMAIVFNWQRIDTLWTQINGTGSSDDLTSAGGLSVKIYIQDALRGLYSNQVVTDPTQNKVYLPEARIYFPLTSLSRGIYYNFQPADSSDPAGASLSTSLNLNRLINKFSEVPCVQKMAGFSIGQKSTIWDSSDLVGQKKLADGRTLYIYENKNKACQDFWPEGYGSSALVKLLNEAQAY